MQSRIWKITSGVLVTVIMLSALLVPAKSLAAGARAYGYRVGYQYDYSWQMDVTTRSTQQNQTGITAKTALTRVSGTATLIPLGTKDDSSMVLETGLGNLRFFTTDERGQLVEATEVPTETIRLAQLPFYFTQLPNGRVTTSLFTTEDTPETANFKRGLISLFQVQITGASETRSESDSSGTYEAQYRTTDQDTTLTITKERTQQSYQSFADPSILAPGAGAAVAPGMLAGDSIAVNGRMVANFDRAEGVLRSVSTTDDVAASTGTGESGYSGEGSAIRSSAAAQGTLTLQGVSPRQSRVFPSFAATATTNEVIAAIQAIRHVTLVIASMVNVNTVPTTSDEVPSLTESLAALRAQPDDARAISALRRSLGASSDQLNELDAALRAGSLPATLYPGIIGALSGLSLPEAQAILAHRFIANPALDAATRERALTAAVLVPGPTPDLIQTVLDLSNNAAFTEAANLVLGALATNGAAGQPQEAARIVGILQTRLAAAQTPAATELALNALGNAGPLPSLSVITPYLNHADLAVRAAALDALRRYPYDAIASYVEPLLENPDRTVQEAAAAIQDDAGVSSQRAASNPQPGEYHWNWQKFIGGGDVKGELLAYLHFYPNDPYQKGYLSAEAKAKAHAWSYTYTLARAKVVSYMSTSTQRYYHAFFYLLGFNLYDKTGSMSCGASYSGNMYQNTLTFFNTSHTFWIFFLPVTLTATATGSLSIPWTIGTTGCSDPLKAKGMAYVTPQVWATVEGTADVSVFVLRGGIGIGAELFKLSLPMSALILQGIAPNPGLGVSAAVNATWQPVYAHVFLWYQWRKWSFWHGFYWGHRYESDLWNYSAPTQYWNILFFNN